MTTEIFVVTFRPHFPYLEWCMKSISKFARGFSKLNVLIPTGDKDAMTVLLSSVVQTHPLPFPIQIHLYDEWQGKGMLHHMRQIMYADEWCPYADFIAHIDADCIFTEPVTPDDYVKDGRPILRYELFDRICRRHGGVIRWKEASERCLPFPIQFETMRCHPEVYHRGLYKESRELIQRHTGRTVDDHIADGPNTFPQQFCEHVTLGNVAIERFRDHYVLIEQSSDRVSPPNKLQQFWSHSPPDKSQHIWVNGKEEDVVPMEFIKTVGI